MVIELIGNVVCTNEQYTKLRKYEDLVLQWQKKMNLVSSSTLQHIWTRHILDSGQLLEYVVATNKHSWVDFGSGAGFPGLVIGLLTGVQMHLIEKSPKKCHFLSYVVNALSLENVFVHNVDARNFRLPYVINFVSARACAPWHKMMSYVDSWFGSHTVGIFHKGRSFMSELGNRDRLFAKYSYSVFPSLLPGGGCIVLLRLKTRC